MLTRLENMKQLYIFCGYVRAQTLSEVNLDRALWQQISGLVRVLIDDAARLIAQLGSRAIVQASLQRFPGPVRLPQNLAFVNRQYWWFSFLNF